MNLVLIFGVVLAGLGGVAAFAGTRVAGRRGEPAAAYLLELEGGGPVDLYDQHLRTPLWTRALVPMRTAIVERLGRLTPRARLDAIHARLLQAGLANTMRAEEVVAAQVIAGALGAIVAVTWVWLGDPAARVAIVGLIVLPGAGLLAPQAWLDRRAQSRKDAIRRDLSDVLDLLAISVEAGVGFEGALEVACQHFDSPLGEELARTLKEMELGLPRREALANLKRRVAQPDLSVFVQAVTQADALGMPLGRVLHTQAAELRSKRRQWARERAGKMPVKILFPLILFIFPAILIVLLGPAASAIYRIF